MKLILIVNLISNDIKKIYSYYISNQSCKKEAAIYKTLNAIHSEISIDEPKQNSYIITNSFKRQVSFQSF